MQPGAVTVGNAQPIASNARRAQSLRFAEVRLQRALGGCILRSRMPIPSLLLRPRRAESSGAILDDAIAPPVAVAPPDDPVQRELMRRWAAAQVRHAIALQALDIARRTLLLVLLAAVVAALIAGMLSGDVHVAELLRRL